MKRTGMGLAATAATALLLVLPAWSAVRGVSVGDFYYLDEATGSSTKIVANEGDQLRFKIAEDGNAVPHTVEVDELGIHSGSLQLGETYTTPKLSKAGTFRLYCKPHNRRGHETTLVVQASAPEPSPTPTSSGGGGSGSGSGSTGSKIGSTKKTSTASGSPSPSLTARTDKAEPSPTESAAPIGRGTLDPSEQVALAPDPNSLSGILGRPPTERGPWTRSLGLAILALPILAGVAAIALWMSRRHVASSQRPGD